MTLLLIHSFDLKLRPLPKASDEFEHLLAAKTHDWRVEQLVSRSDPERCQLFQTFSPLGDLDPRSLK